jgi:hypothetical protein
MYESWTSRGAGIGNAGRSTALTVAIAFLLWLALPGILTPTSSEPVEPALPDSVRTGWWSEMNSNWRYRFVNGETTVRLSFATPRRTAKRYRAAAHFYSALRSLGTTGKMACPFI